MTGLDDDRQLYELADKLATAHALTRTEWVRLIDGRNPELEEYVFSRAREFQHRYYGRQIFVRGLIEMTSYCKNDCYYCGLRRSNRHAQRYRLSSAEILACAEAGYELGYRTFVLQGGEDPKYTNIEIEELVCSLKAEFPDCAVTLSLGERDHDTYQQWFDAGADRYLLRHETADPEHYRMLHPPELSGEHRKNCLWDLKQIGYQTGTGFMVGSPGQTTDCLAEDLMFIRKLEPAMVGIGPFVAHHDTPFAGEPDGSAQLTVYLLGLIRLMMPEVLLPATTALGTIDPQGREKGVLAGANVVMPNLSPQQVRKKYELYDNKICTGEEAAECRGCLQRRMESIGYQVVTGRGDALSFAVHAKGQGKAPDDHFNRTDETAGRNIQKRQQEEAR